MPRAISPTATTERTVVSFAMVPSRLLLLVGLTLIAPPSLADETKDQCLRAYADAQRARKREDLLEARAQLNVCSRSDCPAILQTDCVRWLREVEEAMPSIVIRVRRPSGEDWECQNHPGWAAPATSEARLARRALSRNPPASRDGYRWVERRAQPGGQRFGEESSGVVHATPACLGPGRRETFPSAVRQGGDRGTRVALHPGRSWHLGGGSGSDTRHHGEPAASELHDTCKPNCSESNVSSTRTGDHRG